MDQESDSDDRPYIIFVFVVFAGITFVQKSKNAAGEETAKTSIVNLVDLAGRYVSCVIYLGCGLRLHQIR